MTGNEQSSTAPAGQNSGPNTFFAKWELDFIQSAISQGIYLADEGAKKVAESVIEKLKAADPLKLIAQLREQLAAEAAKCEQMRAILENDDICWSMPPSDDQGTPKVWSKWEREQDAFKSQIAAALALTPSEALREHDLKLAERAFNEGLDVADTYGCSDDAWEQSETRRALTSQATTERA